MCDLQVVHEIRIKLNYLEKMKDTKIFKLKLLAAEGEILNFCRFKAINIGF